MTHSRVRAVRADAVRNRAAILDAARQEITEHGPDVGMDQIARTAGVAVGTLYRHFPTKIDLVAAVVDAYVAQVADRTERALAHVDQGRPAFDELADLLGDIVEAAATNHAVKAAALALNADGGGSDDADDSGDLQRAHRALQALLTSVKADGAVRDDLSVDDFYLLVSNAPAVPTPAVVRRWVELTLFGIVGPDPRNLPTVDGTDRPGRRQRSVTPVRAEGKRGSR